jgi:uncharacterized cofD-like protein
LGETRAYVSRQGQGPIVAVGGGSGPSLVAKALARELERLIAVVCTTDRGSSTGACRRLFRMPAPGDMRAILSTMAVLSGQEAWAALLERRLQCEGNPDLHGMALGNLILAGLFQQEKDLRLVALTMARLLGIRGVVLPATSEDSDLAARLEDGSVVRGEVEVRRVGKPPIVELGWVGEPPRPAPGVLESLGQADLILLGPGCLYTSLLPCLLVKGAAEAIRHRRGTCIYICNTTTTPGQTDGFSAARHVREVVRVLGQGGLDGVLLHQGAVPRETIASYEPLGVLPLGVNQEDLEEINSMGVRHWLFPLTESPPPSPRILHKVDTIRHDPLKLGQALREICREVGVSLTITT